MTKVKHPKFYNPIEKRFTNISCYHYYVFCLLFILKIPVTWHILSLIFLSPPITFYCKSVEGRDVSNASIELKSYCPCDQPIWDSSVFSETTQTKFGLYCEDAWLTSFTQSMFYVGLLIGSFVFGFLSDRFGRLSAFSLSALVVASAGCLVAVMPTVASFTFIRCIEGIGCGGAIVTSFVLCIEYTGVRYRELVTAIYHLSLNFAHISLAGWSYWLRSCDELQIALSIPMFLCVAIRWLIMESPKWLMDNEKFDEAAFVMEKFGRLHATETRKDLVEELSTFHKNHSSTKEAKMSFFNIFKHKQVTINFLCMCVIYFVCGMGYYGMSQFIGQMNGDIHINVALSGIIMIPGSVASVFLLQTLSRRTFLFSTCLMSGVLTMVVVCIPANVVWCRVLIASFGNCFFFMCFIIVFLYGVELFPTSIRNSALGFLSVMSRLGQISAPPINSLTELKAGMIFGIMAIIGCILCYPLQETKNIELPSSYEDTKYLKHRVVKLIEENDSTEATTSN